MNFDLKFEGDQNPLQLKEDFNNILYKDLPKIRYDRWLGYNLGDLLIYYQNFSEFTEVPLKFRVLNLTWSSDLSSELSPRYRLHAERFCADVSWRHLWTRQIRPFELILRGRVITEHIKTTRITLA